MLTFSSSEFTGGIEGFEVESGSCSRCAAVAPVVLSVKTSIELSKPQSRHLNR